MDKEPKAAFLDRHMRLRLADLDPETFERFFLHFFNSGISLEIERDGSRVERRIIEANTYAAGSGRSQEGVDLIAKVEGGETWAFQCKRHKKWSPAQTKAAIAKATDFPAQHYFLLVACDPGEGVQKVIAAHPTWSFWNLDRICAEFRLRVPKSKQPPVLHILRPEEIQRFAPYATDAFIFLPADYFASLNRAGHSFHHRYTLVGAQPGDETALVMHFPLARTKVLANFRQRWGRQEPALVGILRVVRKRQSRSGSRLSQPPFKRQHTPSPVGQGNAAPPICGRRSPT